jgi:hypothetical protein
MILVYFYIELNNTTSYVIIEFVDSSQKKIHDDVLYKFISNLYEQMVG